MKNIKLILISFESEEYGHVARLMGYSHEDNLNNILNFLKDASTSRDVVRLGVNWMLAPLLMLKTDAPPPGYSECVYEFHFIPAATPTKVLTFDHEITVIDHVHWDEDEQENDHQWYSVEISDLKPRNHSYECGTQNPVESGEHLEKSNFNIG